MGEREIRLNVTNQAPQNKTPPVKTHQENIQIAKKSYLEVKPDTYGALQRWWRLSIEIDKLLQTPPGVKHSITRSRDSTPRSNAKRATCELPKADTGKGYKE